jgi:translocation and assembly module TamB
VRGEGDPEGGIDFQGSVRSGEGTFEMEGRTPTVPTTDAPAELTLTGERFLAIATPEIQVEIEPDLQISYDGSLTTVGGSLVVPWARVELVEVPEAAIPPSADVVFAGEVPVEPPRVSARVDVVIGDDVRFEGFGFSSMIEGDLEIREEPENVPLVFGELNLIDGRYAAYGQNLDVDPGRVVFAGPAEDATLDVTAERLAQDGTSAGVVISGSALDPQIEIVSTPAMSDADALSYIMYGTSMSDGDASQQQRVAGVAATLGANVLTTKLAGSVGLDEARIEGATRDQAEFVAGKYLTPSIFVSYGVGLFKPSNTFRIKYLLSSNWALQAESGDANGGDLLYQIERGN